MRCRGTCQAYPACNTYLKVGLAQRPMRYWGTNQAYLGSTQVWPIKRVLYWAYLGTGKTKPGMYIQIMTRRDRTYLDTGLCAAHIQHTARPTFHVRKPTLLLAQTTTIPERRVQYEVTGCNGGKGKEPRIIETPPHTCSISKTYYVSTRAY